MATTNKFFKVKNGLDVNSNATVDASGNANVSGNVTANSGYVSADTFRLDTSYAGGSTQPGEISWDPDNETAMIALDAGETLQIGQEHVIRVKNSSGSAAIPKGRVVMFAGATGDTVTVTPAISTQAYEPLLLVGVTAEEIAADGFGFVTQYGFINQVSTGSFTLGALLYVNPASPGVLTSSLPSAPNWTFPVAAVTRVHASAGRILVRAIPGGHLHDVVDVAISSPDDNEVLAYNSGSGVWINQTASEAGLAALSGATFTGNVAGTNISVSGNVNAVTVNATTFSGSGASLTSIPAANITGTVANATTGAVANQVGFLGIPRSSQNTTSTLALSDIGDHLYVTASGQTITIPSNANVAFPIGAAITIIAVANTVSVAYQAGVTIYQAGLGLIASSPMTVGAYGMGTLLKVDTNTWYISGVGVTD